MPSSCRKNISLRDLSIVYQDSIPWLLFVVQSSVSEPSVYDPFPELSCIKGAVGLSLNQVSNTALGFTVKIHSFGPMSWSSMDFTIPTIPSHQLPKQQKQLFSSSSFPTPRRQFAWGNKDGSKYFLLKTPFFSPFSKVPQSITMLLLPADLVAFKDSTHLNCSEFSATHSLQPYRVLPFAEASAETSSLTSLQHQLGSSSHNEDLLLATPWCPGREQCFVSSSAYIMSGWLLWSLSVTYKGAGGTPRSVRLKDGSIA